MQGVYSGDTRPEYKAKFNEKNSCKSARADKVQSILPLKKCTCSNAGESAARHNVAWIQPKNAIFG